MRRCVITDDVMRYINTHIHTRTHTHRKIHKLLKVKIESIYMLDTRSH